MHIALALDALAGMAIYGGYLAYQLHLSHNPPEDDHEATE